MLCSYKNSCFCFVTIKINVKVLGNYWWLNSISADVPFVSACGDLDCMLTSLNLKVYLPFAKEKGLTHVIWYLYN